MKLPAPEEGKRRFQVLVQAYGEAVRDGLVFLAWTVVALIAAGAAFLVLRLGWWLLVLALRAMGEI